MGVFDTQTNIKRNFIVGDFYEIVVSNGGMTGSLDDNAKKVFKPGVTLDDVIREMLNTPLKDFDKLFTHPLEKWIYINGDGFRFNWIGMWRLKKFLRRWIKKEYIAGYNKPSCERDEIHTKSYAIITVYNGEVIESATGACFWFFFKRK